MLRRLAGAACAAALLLPAGKALADYVCGTSDAISIATAVLAAPSDPGAAVGTCTAGASVDVEVTWTASPSSVADGYAILRSDGGAATQVGTASGHDTTSFVDASGAFATSYTYTVEATRGSWTSAPSANANVTTPASDCS